MFFTKKILLAATAICFSLTFSFPTVNGTIHPGDLILIHEAFVPKFTDPLPLQIITIAPPSPINENVPPKPSGDVIWISGYWSWLENQNEFTWICGVWRKPPIGHHWISGTWVQNTDGWIWARGFWSHVPFERLQYIKEAPPSIITDKIPQSPGNNFFWAPGFWNYSAGNYSWLSGKWEPSNQNWILAPAAYIWRPSGFVFVPIYWDWLLEARGSAYSCNDNGPLVIIDTPIIVQRLFFCYPDYLCFYWHWCHFHPGWGWDDCGCVPPWWHWHDWWCFGWADCWGLWWWWGHPGALPPFWLHLELSKQIAPPPLTIIDFFKKISQPKYNLKLGDIALLPSGTPGTKDLPLPEIPNNVTPSGQITLPKLPDLQITLPPLPQPQNTQDVPTGPYYPTRPPQRDYSPPEDYTPPTYYPPNRHRPPGRPHYPDFNWPRDDHGSDRPGRGHDDDDNDRPPTHPRNPKYPINPNTSGSQNNTPNWSPNYTPNNPQRQTGPRFTPSGNTRIKKGD